MGMGRLGIFGVDGIEEAKERKKCVCWAVRLWVRKRMNMRRCAHYVIISSNRCGTFMKAGLFRDSVII